MSAGHVHTKASLILASGFLVGTIVTGDPESLEYVVGALIGVVLTPDVDVDAGYIGDRYIRHKIGKWAERIWDWFWNAYRKSVKHGSDLSHAPVLGTTARIAYIYWMLIVIPHFIIAMVLSPSWNLWDVLTWYAMLIISYYKVILALMGADLIHWALDVLTKENTKNVRHKRSGRVAQYYGSPNQQSS